MVLLGERRNRITEGGVEKEIREVLTVVVPAAGLPKSTDVSMAQP